MTIDLREQLATLAHEQWSGWMEYFLDKCHANEDGSLTVSVGYVTALKRQMTTPYAWLTEQEKDSDRKEADKVLSLVRAHIR